MSLFYIDEADQTNELVSRMSKLQYEQSPGLYDELPERARKFMKRDFYYAISYLKSALDLQEETIFVSYVRWTYEYLSYLMNYVSKEKMKDQCVDFYVAMENCLQEEMLPQQYQLAKTYIHHGIDEINRIYQEGFSVEDNFKNEEYEKLISDYLSLVLRKDSRSAMHYFVDLYNKGMTIDVIYVEIVQNVMRKIGELWFENKISVAQEHYCSALTQTAISQLYSVIFASQPLDHTMIGCCLGGELHELGMRMITDLFTYEGWNAVFLGAGVPEEALFASIEEHHPDLIALSITMPQHLMLCKHMIEQLRNKYPEIKIAIGGRAFDDIPDVLERWPADIYTKDARGLVQWAQKNFQ